MKPLPFSGWCIIAGTLLLALILMILPMPHWAVDYRPAWLLLVILYWTMALPHRMGVGMAWISGLCLDSLQGTLLGENALSFAMLAYLALKFSHQIRLFSLVTQSIIIFALLLCNQLLLLGLQRLQGQTVSTQWFFGVMLTSTLLWPWIVMVLGNCLKRYKLY